MGTQIQKVSTIGGANVNVFPTPIIAQRAPASTDVDYPLGQIWIDASVSPAVSYEFLDSALGTWSTGGNAPATTTEYGTVLLTDNSEPVATKAYADALAIAGAPAWSETVSGIGQLSTLAEAVAGTNDDTAMTPLKVAGVFAAPPAIGSGTPAAGSFTTLDASGLASLSGSATILTAGTALNLASDADTAAVNLGTGAAARTITVGNVSGATAVNVNTGTGGFAVATTGAGDIVLNSDDTFLIDADGVLELNSSAGVISIGNDADANNINIGTGAAARTITIGNGTGASSVVIDSGTGAINIGVNAVAHSVTIGNGTGATAVVLDAGTGGVNVGTNAIAHTITIGNITGATAVNVNSGTGACAWTTTNGSFGLVTGTGAINLGADAAAKTITIGNITGATAVNVNSGSGSCAWTTTNGSFSVVTGTGAINIGADAAAKTITVGNATGATAVNINAGSGAVNCSTDFNLSSVATKISMNGGAVTDFIGTATLTNGTVTVANTNIAAGDRVIVTRSAKNGSTAYGTFEVVKSAGVNFVITSCQSDTTTETGDQSVVDYVIFRQT